MTIVSVEMIRIAKDKRKERTSISTVRANSDPTNDARMIRHVRERSFSRRSAVMRMA